MAKVQYLFTLFCILLMELVSSAQNNYALVIEPADKSVAFIESLGLRKTFINKDECSNYISNIVPGLQAKGYVTASVDSVRFDSTAAYIKIFFGQLYQWKSIGASEDAAKWLRKTGWHEGMFNNEPLNYERIERLQEQMLN